MNRYTVAHDLGVPIGVVLDMPVDQYMGHLAYIKIQAARRR